MIHLSPLPASIVARGAGCLTRDAVEVAEHVLGYRVAVECGDVGGVDGVGEIADGEDVRSARGLAGVDGWASCPGVHVQASGARELVIGDPVAGEHHGVAGHGAARMGFEVLYLDGVDPITADDLGDAGAGGNRDPEREPAGNGEAA